MKKVRTQLWFIIDGKEFPTDLLGALTFIPNKGELIAFPKHFKDKQFEVDNVEHVFREDTEEVIHDIYLNTRTKT